MQTRRAVLACIAWLCASGSQAAYDIPQHVIAGGGGSSSGGSYALTGTIGQSVVGQSSGGSYSMFGGFWGGGSLGVMDILVNLVLAGTGTGTVTSVPAGISCPGTCSFQFNSIASVSLNGTPANASNAFTGWLGPCTGTGDCVLATAGTQNVTATFAPNDAYTFRIDVDKNNAYDALTDGLLIVRGLFGLTDNGLIAGAVGPNAAAFTASALLDRIRNLKPLLDVDGNGTADAFTDGVMIIRYLSGLRGDAITANALGAGAQRDAQQIQAYIQSLTPP